MADVVSVFVVIGAVTLGPFNTPPLGVVSRAQLCAYNNPAPIFEGSSIFTPYTVGDANRHCGKPESAEKICEETMRALGLIEVTVLGSADPKYQPGTWWTQDWITPAHCYAGVVRGANP